LKLLNLASV